MAIFDSSRHQQRATLKKLSLQFLYVCVGALFLLPTCAFLLIVQLPLFLYRLLVTKLFAPCFRPKIGNAVTPNAQFLTTEFLEKRANKPSRYTLLTNCVVKGTLTTAELRELVLTRWIQAKKPEDGTPCYPEFQQYIESWMGFMFWKLDTNFNVDDHIIVHNLDKHAQQRESEIYLATLCEKILNEPFVPYRSPWDIHLIQNYKTSEIQDKELTGIVFRFHHAFGDGFALLHVIAEALFGCKFENVQMQVPRERWQRKQPSAGVIMGTLLLPFKYLHDFGYVVTIGCSKQNIWKNQEIANIHLQTGRSSEGLGKIIFLKSHRISVEKFKKIKNCLGVSLPSVLLSSLSASLAKNFQSSTPVIRQNNVRITMQLPTAGHTKKLRNVTHSTIFSIDTQPQVNSLQRLLETERRLNETKTSFVPNIILALHKTLSGSLATPFARIVDSSQCIPVCVSNFRGPEKPFGLDAERMMLTIDPVLATYSDIMIAMCSYNGYMRVILTTKNYVLDETELEKLLSDFCEEIETLHEIANKEEISV